MMQGFIVFFSFLLLYCYALLFLNLSVMKCELDLFYFIYLALLSFVTQDLKVECKCYLCSFGTLEK